MNPQNFSRGESSYYNYDSQQQPNQRNWYNKINNQQPQAFHNNNEHLDGRTYRKIIIPKGSIQSNQAAVINIPENLQSGKVLICRKLPQQTYRVDESAPRVPQDWNNSYGYLNSPRGHTAAGRTNGPVNDSRRNNDTDMSFSPQITSTPRKFPISNAMNPKVAHKPGYRPADMKNNTVYFDPPKGWDIGGNLSSTFQKQAFPGLVTSAFPALITSFSPSPIKMTTMTDTLQDGIPGYSKFAPPVISSPTSSRFQHSRSVPNRSIPNQTNWANDLRNQTRQEDVFQSLMSEPDDQYMTNNLLNQSHEQEIINNLVKSSAPQPTQESFKSLPFVTVSNGSRSDQGSNSSMISNRATPSTATGFTKDLTCTSWSTLPTRCVSTEKITTSTEKVKEKMDGHVPMKKTKSKTKTVTEKITSTPSCSSISSIQSCRGRLNLSSINLHELDQIEERERKQLDHDLRKLQRARRKLATNLAAHCL